MKEREKSPDHPEEFKEAADKLIHDPRVWGTALLVGVTAGIFAVHEGKRRWKLKRRKLDSSQPDPIMQGLDRMFNGMREEHPTLSRQDELFYRSMRLAIQSGRIDASSSHNFSERLTTFRARRRGGSKIIGPSHHTISNNFDLNRRDILTAIPTALKFRFFADVLGQGQTNVLEEMFPGLNCTSPDALETIRRGINIVEPDLTEQITKTIKVSVRSKGFSVRESSKKHWGIMDDRIRRKWPYKPLRDLRHGVTPETDTGTGPDWLEGKHSLVIQNEDGLVYGLVQFFPIDAASLDPTSKDAIDFNTASWDDIINRQKDTLEGNIVVISDLIPVIPTDLDALAGLHLGLMEYARKNGARSVITPIFAPHAKDLQAHDHV